MVARTDVKISSAVGCEAEPDSVRKTSARWEVNRWPDAVSASRRRRVESVFSALMAGKLIAPVTTDNVAGALEFAARRGVAPALRLSSRSR